MYSNVLIECDPDSTKYLLEHVLDYYPYGRTLREHVHERERFQTTHHERDAETGLDYRGARFYDGDVGRFLSTDPLAADYAAWSAYNYVMGNPIRLVDPDGRSVEDVYYDQNGNFLYKDNQTTDNVRIISKDDFDLIKFDFGEGLRDKNNTDINLLASLQEKSTGIGDAELSVGAVSKITTDILSKMTDVDIGGLYNGKVSVIDWGTGAKYNEPEKAASLANTLVTENGIKITVPIRSGRVSPDLTTVANMENALGAHEYQGHGVLRFGDANGNHHKAYEHQFQHSSWQQTTPEFKAYMKESY